MSMMPDPPIPPPPPIPIVHRAARDIEVPVVDNTNGGATETMRQVYLLRDSPDVMHAYLLDQGARATDYGLDGQVLIATLLTRQPRTDGIVVFTRSSNDVKVSIRKELLAGLPVLSEEDVMDCFEALKDQYQIYIISLLGGQCMDDIVPPSGPILGAAARNVPIQVISENGDEKPETADLCAYFNVQQAYQFLTPGNGFPRTRLPLGNGRGEVIFAQKLLRDERFHGRLVFRRSDDNYVAIKKLRRWVIDPPLREELRGGSSVVENPYMEVYIMQRFGDGQHVVQCHEALYDKHYLYIVMPLAPGGDLRRHIDWFDQVRQERGYNPRDQVKYVILQLLQNLQYLRDCRLVHRDLKPENILHMPPFFPVCDCAQTLQLPYFRLSNEIDPQDEEGGTPTYSSPEDVLNQPLDAKSDMWSFGSIAFNLLTGKRFDHRPFPGGHILRHLNQVEWNYNFFIRGGGFLRDARLEGYWNDLRRNGQENSDLGRLIQAVRTLNRGERQLLQIVLKHDPRERPEVEQVRQILVLQIFFDAINQNNGDAALDCMSDHIAVTYRENPGRNWQGKEQGRTVMVDVLRQLHQNNWNASYEIIEQPSNTSLVTREHWGHANSYRRCTYTFSEDGGKIRSMQS